MTFCSKCGKEIPPDAVYCPSCGAQTNNNNTASNYTSSSPTEFDRLTKDRVLQEHWLTRVVAFIIDAVVFAIGFGILALIVFFSVGFPLVLFGGGPVSLTVASLPFNTLGILPLGWVWSILFWMYFAIAEAWYGKTIGKSIMHLQVGTTGGGPADFEKTLIRNFSKIIWVLLLLDIIGGLFTRTLPGQKFSDHFAGTIVAKDTR